MSRRRPGDGAACNAVLRLSSGVSDTLRIASDWCWVDCSPLQVILNCCEGFEHPRRREKFVVAFRMSEEKTLSAESLVKLLQAVKMASSPTWAFLLENLQKSAA